MAYDVLNHLHGDTLIKPTSGSQTPLVGQMIVYDQKAFMNPPSTLVSGKITSSSLSKWIAESMVVYDSKSWDWPTSGLFNWTIPRLSETKETTARTLTYGFDEKGFLYFPSACAQGEKCSIHVALHGCQQGPYQ